MSIEPCYDKKLEATRWNFLEKGKKRVTICESGQDPEEIGDYTKEVDLVLTTDELLQLMTRKDNNRLFSELQVKIDLLIRANKSKS